MSGLRSRPRLATGLVVAVLVLLAAVAGYWWQRPMLRTGTGYAAHNACALTHLAGRQDPQRDLPDNPLVPYLRSRSDATGASATALGVLAGQRATFTQGYGCTLGEQAPGLPPPVRVDRRGNPLDSQPTPRETSTARAALDAAFGADLPPERRQALGTRAVVVVRDGRIVAERYGDGYDRDTPQLGWSLTKSVTNLVAGRVVAQGQVDVTDDHLHPQWRDGRADITVEDLLRQRSGLAWDERYVLGSAVTTMLYNRDDMTAFVAAQPLAHAPGEYQQYSSGNPVLTCDVLARRTGHRSDLFARELFAPLGLSSALVEPDGAGTPVCGSYMWATPRDWAAIGQFALDAGRWQGRQLLPKDWMTWSTTPHRGPGEENPHGAGWWVNRSADGKPRFADLPTDTYWASGHDGQRVMVVPSQRLIVVRMGFSPGTEDEDLRMERLVDAFAAD